MLKAVLFDFDYTLVDASVGIILCTYDALRIMGHDLPTEDKVRSTIGLPLEEMFTVFTGNSDSVAKKTFKDLYVKAADGVITKHTRFFDDALYVLQVLAENNIKVVIVSTKYRYRIEEVLQRDDLMSIVSLVVGGEDVAKHKPDPEGVFLVLKTLGIASDEALFVGDTILDQGAADAAGVEFKAVLNGTTSFETFVNNGVSESHIFRNLTDLLKSLMN
jgi:phosphoglycolate phosphatase